MTDKESQLLDMRFDRHVSAMAIAGLQRSSAKHGYAF
jgi:hypothetical protein